MADAAAASGRYSIARREGERGAARAAGRGARRRRPSRCSTGSAVGAGWHCLDLGCGPRRDHRRRSSARVGRRQRRPGSTSTRSSSRSPRSGRRRTSASSAGDAYADRAARRRPSTSSHMRFLASTAGDAGAARRRGAPADAAGRLRRGAGGGLLDAALLPARPGLDDARRPPIRACFPFTAEDPEAHRVYRLMRAAGLEDVGYRPVLVGVRVRRRRGRTTCPRRSSRCGRASSRAACSPRAGARRGARGLPGASGGAGHGVHRPSRWCRPGDACRRRPDGAGQSRASSAASSARRP